MAKPSSMASLREKAMAFLRDDREPKERNIVDLAAEVRDRDREREARPNTPGVGTMGGGGRGGVEGHGKAKGFFGRLKGMVVGKPKGELH